MTSDPLETPTALPARWVPLVRAVTGRTHGRFTTGAATRRALSSAGARGATSGTTLHLARTPIAADLPVVAHELAHSRMPLARPRFLLERDHAGDADERAAHEVAGGAMNAVRPATPDVGRLPVTGLGGLPQAVGNLMDRASQVRQPGRASPGTAGDAARTALDQLSPGDRAGSSFSESGNAVGSPGGSSASTGSVPGLDAATGTTDTTATTDPAAAAAAGLDLDQLIESLETRLIRELERRGGRFADVF